MQDPISDLLTRLRNAQMAGHETVLLPASKTKLAILKVLVDEGYVTAKNILKKENWIWKKKWFFFVQVA